VQQRKRVVVQPERRHAFDRRVQGGTEREDVRRGGRLPTLRDLGREVGRRPGDHARAGQLHLVDGTGDAEVGQLHQPVRGDQHVAGLHVAVHDTRVMGRGQPVRHLAADVRGLDGRQRPLPRDAGRERLRGQVLHDQPRPLLVDHHVEHADHMGVLQPRADPAFTQDPLARLFDLRPALTGRNGEQLLHRDRAAQQLVGGPPHHPHGAHTDALLEAVSVGDQHGNGIRRRGELPRGP
jgi:hypothetical protein